ncbi:hypothetical protein ING2E5A_1680 [Petrimonas mucosa]|jgi:hypothetical protein|uniref:Uncharacterized protein n=1 Tax=Petrimonas mucosa TaxID=1642646 RepID=A0A1G4G7M1_9BACT|nr:hypothetical protein ING2E5A_1680 [Petrimonas mucosa]SFU55300.1 hypothetical protein SAMN05216364_10242 [Porphyromonadaceae bacterium KHP3R9]
MPEASGIVPLLIEPIGESRCKSTNIIRIYKIYSRQLFHGRVKQQVQFTLIVCKTQLWVC